MKNTEILLHHIYWDCKHGVREVVDAGEHLVQWDGQQDRDVIAFHMLSSRSSEPWYQPRPTEEECAAERRTCTRAAFAAWARTEVPRSDLPDVLASILASKRASKISPAQSQALLAIAASQAGGEAVVGVPPGAWASVHKLASQQFLIVPSGTRLTRLTVAGKHLLSQWPEGRKALATNFPEFMERVERVQTLATPPTPRRGPRP